MASNPIGTHVHHDHNASQPFYLPNNAPEWERLDEMHEGIDTYLHHKLCLGPAVQNAKKILEIGCGSGAWAIQAAQTYSEATVTAIDVSPLPPRSLPSNMQFQQLNVMEPLPFEPESFDIIHARFVFLHLPNWKQVLTNVVPLLKSGGWLWIEDADLQLYDDGPQGLAPSLKVFNDKYLSFSRSKNVDPLVGSSLNTVLNNLEVFSEVNDIGIKCPANGKDNDPSLQLIGQVIYTSLRRMMTGLMGIPWTAAGITSELMEAAFQEAEEPSGSVYLPIHMTWSQKK